MVDTSSDSTTGNPFGSGPLTSGDQAGGAATASGVGSGSDMDALLKAYGYQAPQALQQSPANNATSDKLMAMAGGFLSGRNSREGFANGINAGTQFDEQRRKDILSQNNAAVQMAQNQVNNRLALARLGQGDQRIDIQNRNQLLAQKKSDDLNAYRDVMT